MKQLLSNKDYHNHAAIGSTTLKAIAKKSLLHAMEQEFKQTDALVLGSAVHAAILEPETFSNEYLVSPKFDRRTKVGKEDYAAFQDLAQGKTVINEEQMEVVEAIKSSVMCHSIANSMITGGDAEFSYFATCPETGLELKCRPDYVKSGALIDLKTCQDASTEGFTRACINFGYAIQAAFYLDVYNLANKTDLKEFYFLAVETSKPYAVNIFKMGDVEINMGRQQYKSALQELAEFKKDETKLRSFGYSQEIKELQFPIWALKKMEALA